MSDRCRSHQDGLELQEEGGEIRRLLQPLGGAGAAGREEEVCEWEKGRSLAACLFSAKSQPTTAVKRAVCD